MVWAFSGHEPYPNHTDLSLEGLLIPIWALALLCFGITVAYASVGLGGGTAYTALLAILGASHQMIPTVSLLLNVVVTTIGSAIFLRARHGRADLILPFVSTSVPAAYLGGLLEVSPDLFYRLLLITLVIVAARIFIWKDAALDIRLGRFGRIATSLAVGTGLGLVAGIVGIGGGIYLVPLILMLGLGTEREAAAAGAVFTWINSVAGLAARVQRPGLEWTQLAPLAGAVAIGAVLGAWMGATWLSRRALQRVLGVIVIVAIALLIDDVFVG